MQRFSIQEAGLLLRILLALGIIVSGVVATGLGASGRFLPHDEAFLGMTATDLCALHGCRIVHFMIHDRVSFGGALLAIGVLYAWLAVQRAAWAWWTLLVSNVAGFLSFFAYLGYGYLDTWHGVGTLALLPLCVGGLALSRPEQGSYRALLRLARPICWGRVCLLATAIVMMGAGLTIMLVGMTCVFVPEDLAYMGLSVEEMNSLNPRLVPLIAHDRAGFGGAVFCVGVTLFFCLWCGHPPRSVLVLAGIAGFGTAVFIHPAIGYTDPVHLAPAVLGAVAYGTGIALMPASRLPRRFRPWPSPRIS